MEVVELSAPRRERPHGAEHAFRGPPRSVLSHGRRRKARGDREPNEDDETHDEIVLTHPKSAGKRSVNLERELSACSASYHRVPRLFEELRIAKADGSYARKLMKMAKLDLLILDDLGLGHLEETRRHDLLEVLADRYGKRSTVVSSQLPIRNWHEWIGDPTLADAILDRLVHNAYEVQLEGASRRKTDSKDTD